MKIYKDLYWSIISPQALFRAWEIFKSDKRNKSDVVEFEMNLEQNIFDLYRDLKNETYKHGPYRGFWIHDPKLRRIHKATVRDRVLHHAVFYVLNRIFEPTFISDSYSCRIGKGTHKGVEKVADMIRAVSSNNTQPCFALKCDVKKFFDSVDHKTLIGILRKKIKDICTMNLLEEIVKSYAANGSVFTRERESKTPPFFNKKGVPIGNLTSQIFANVYMNEFDQFVKHELKIEYYARYTDDFIIISKNKNYLKELLLKLQTFLLENLKLELHRNKIIIRKHHKGIDFLGQVIFPHHRLLRKKTQKRIVRNLKNKVDLYRRGCISESSLKHSMQSYFGVLSHADTFQFQESLKNQIWFWLND